MMVPRVSARAGEAADTLPAPSVWVAVRLLVPADRVLVVTDQLPFAPTVAAPTCTWPSNRAILSPATPVPVITGGVGLVMLSPGVPLSLAGARVRPDGAGSVAVRLLVPAGRVLGVTDQLPFAPTVAAPTCTWPSNRAIVSPATPVPVITGVVTLVMLSPGVPLSLAGARVRPDGAGMVALAGIVSVSLAPPGPATLTLLPEMLTVSVAS